MKKKGTKSREKKELQVEDEPEAVRELRRVSEIEEDREHEQYMKYPYRSIHRIAGEERVSKWGREEGSRYPEDRYHIREGEDGQNMRKVLRQKGSLHYNKIRSKRQEHHLRALASSNLNKIQQSIERVTEQQQYQLLGPITKIVRARCAISRLQPNFTEIPKYQRYRTVSSSDKIHPQSTIYREMSTDKNKSRTARVCQEKCLVIRRIKREILKGREQRNKVASILKDKSQHKEEQSDNRTASGLGKVCQLAFHLPGTSSSKDIYKEPRAVRLLPHNNFYKYKSVEVSGSPHRVNASSSPEGSNKKVIPQTIYSHGPSPFRGFEDMEVEKSRELRKLKALLRHEQKG